MAAHDQLEELILDRETMAAKKKLGSQMAQVVYEGKWFTPLREAIQAFVTSTQQYVTGEVKFKLYKGNIIKAGTTSPYSLYLSLIHILYCYLVFDLMIYALFNSLNLHNI